MQVQSNEDDGNGGENPPNPQNPDDCPDDYVWDITIRAPAERGTSVPVGTIICLTEGLGTHEATVLEPGEEPYATNVRTDQPNVTNCNSPGSQRAQVTSGDPPTPLNMDSFLCAEVNAAPT